jgi:hypothetical protein
MKAAAAGWRQEHDILEDKNACHEHDEHWEHGNEVELKDDGLTVQRNALHGRLRAATVAVGPGYWPPYYRQIRNQQSRR